jgi:EAL domain-containing protein (putative c-di-GMP-specific phosphodiesterase class I)
VYRHDNVKFANFELANLSELHGIDKKLALLEVPVFDDGVKIGSVGFIYAKSNNYENQALIIIGIITLIGLTSFVMIGKFRIIDQFKNISVNETIRPYVDSEEFFEAAMGQSGLEIKYSNLINYNKENNKKIIHAYIEWNKGNKAKENISILDLSDLITQDDFVMPIMPWIHRKILLLNQNNISDGKAVEILIDVNMRQFLSKDYREFLINLAKSVNYEISRLKIIVDEVALSRQSRERIESAWANWSGLGVGIVVTNFGKTTLSLSIIEEFEVDKIRCCLSWLRYQWYSEAARDRIKSLLAVANQTKIDRIVYGNPNGDDLIMISDLNFEWLEDHIDYSRLNH